MFVRVLLCVATASHDELSCGIDSRVFTATASRRGKVPSVGAGKRHDGAFALADASR